MKALFDSNILIDYLMGSEWAREEIARHDVLLISAITWMEVMVGAKPDEDTAVRAFLKKFRVVPVDTVVMEAAVRIRRQRGMKLPDAIIWATAQSEYALLVTRDEKAFSSASPDVRIPYKIHDEGPSAETTR